MKYLSSILVSNNIQTNRIKMDRNILMTSLCVADNAPMWCERTARIM